MLIFGVLRSGLFSLTSVGLALSVGVIGIVNFAHGEFLMLGAFLGYWLYASYGVDPLAAIPFGAAALFAMPLTLARDAVLGRTRIGKAMRAVAQSRRGAALLGIEVERVYLLAFGISTALAATAGMMITLQLSVSPYIGLLYTLKAFAIIVIAGLGNINGVIYASLVLGLSEAFVEFYVPHGGGGGEGVFFLLILPVLIVRPRGLFRC